MPDPNMGPTLTAAGATFKPNTVIGPWMLDSERGIVFTDNGVAADVFLGPLEDVENEPYTDLSIARFAWAGSGSLELVRILLKGSGKKAKIRLTGWNQIIKIKPNSSTGLLTHWTPELIYAATVQAGAMTGIGLSSAAPSGRGQLANDWLYCDTIVAASDTTRLLSPLDVRRTGSDGDDYAMTLVLDGFGCQKFTLDVQVGEAASSAFLAAADHASAANMLRRVLNSG